DRLDRLSNKPGSVVARIITLTWRPSNAEHSYTGSSRRIGNSRLIAADHSSWTSNCHRIARNRAGYDRGRPDSSSCAHIRHDDSRGPDPTVRANGHGHKIPSLIEST